MWKENIFPEHLGKSIMFGEKGNKDNEWTLIKRGKYAVGYEINGNGPLWGNGYALTYEDIVSVKNFFNAINLQDYKESYAEEIFWKNNMKFEIQQIYSTTRIEIDTIDDLRAVEPQYLIESFSNVMQCIKIVHDIDEDEIKKFSAIKGGLTNDTYKYRVKNEHFVIRFPREETNKNIDRYSERIILESIKDFKIGAEIHYINDKAGVLITKLIKNAKSFKKTKKNIEEVARKLKKIHNSNIKVKNSMEPLELFQKYTKENKINDSFVLEKKEEILRLIEKYYSNHSEFNLCHNDMIEGNIIWNNSGLWLIDWELANNNDPYWDIASLFM
ncbi:choline/ethanolamine kinase family protein, partial [Mycoplasma marinum]|uniref:choline/ethanolamine kinase family protein n=1 Tax=Mycoplasma marinum TaxID=1937190 RepID=UPI00103D704C